MKKNSNFQWVVLALALVALVACESQYASGPPPGTQVGAAAAAPVVSAKTREREEYKRPETGGVPRRDPFFFEPPTATEEGAGEDVKIGPTAAFSLTSLKLVAIVSGSAKPRAMFVDPSGLGHIVAVDDRIASEGALIRDIRTNEVEVETSASGGNSDFDEIDTVPGDTPDTEKTSTTVIIRLSDTELPPAESDDSKDEDILKEIDKRPEEVAPNP